MVSLGFSVTSKCERRRSAMSGKVARVAKTEGRMADGSIKMLENYAVQALVHWLKAACMRSQAFSMLACDVAIDMRR